MTRVVRVALMFLLVGLISSSRADANIIDWLDRLSGPGPFWGADVAIAMRCPSGPRMDTTPQQLPPSTRTTSEGIVVSCPGERLDRKHSNWYLILGASGTGRNHLNYGDQPSDESKAIGIFKMGSAFDYTLLPFLDVGVGGGFLYFFGPRFPNFAHPYVQPFRISIRPLLLGWRSEPRSKDPEYIRKLEKRGWLLINFDLNIIAGTIDGSSFGAPGDPWRVENDVVPEIGIGLDVVKLFSRKH